MYQEKEESMHFKASCQFGFVLVFTAQGRMFVTVFPMVCHILAFLVNFYIKNLSQSVYCLYFEAELPLQVPLGSCPPSVPGRARCPLPCAHWTVHWWVVAMTVFFQFRTGIKILPLAMFFVIALMRAASFAQVLGDTWALLLTHSLPEPPSNLFSLHRAVAAATLTSFWGIICPELWIIQCFCKSHWNNLPKHCRVFGVEDGTGLLCALWHWVTEGLRWEIPTALWQGWFSRMQ